MFSVCKQLFDGMGRTRVGMVVNLGGLLMNICLNWVLIYGNLGAPKLGIEGAAVATAVTRVSMMLFMFGYIAYDKQIADLRIAYTRLQTQGKTYTKQILTIGVPAGLQFFFEVAAFSITQMMSGWLGVMFLASHQIAIGLASITFMVLTGISSAGTIMTGYAYGAKNKEDARIAGNTIFMLTIALEIVFAIVFLAGHKLLPLLYTNDAELIKVTATLLLFAAFFQISDGLQSAAAGVLRGIQDVKIPSAIAFISYWLIMIPSSYYLGFHTSLGINGLWLGFIIGLTVAALALMLRFWWKVKRIEFEEL
jgi:MATE family multidrug resistance protein